MMRSILMSYKARGGHAMRATEVLQKYLHTDRTTLS